MADRGALCRGQKLGEHRAGAGVDAAPDNDQYVLPVMLYLADTVQGVSSEQRLHGCRMSGVAIDTANGFVLRGLQSFQLTQVWSLRGSNWEGAKNGTSS